MTLFGRISGDFMHEISSAMKYEDDALYTAAPDIC